MKKFISVLLILALIFSLTVISAAAETEYILTNLGIPMQTYISDSATTERLYARSVWDIEEYGGRIYIGGGNYNIYMTEAIDGGVPVLSYSAKKGWVKEASFYEHQISRFIKADGKLYIPATDHSGGGGYVYFYDGKTAWQAVDGFSAAVHTFDLLVKDGVIYAGYGFVQNAAARVFASKDGGVTYNPIYCKYNGSSVTTNGEDNTSDYPRIYNLFEFGGDVYAAVTIVNATSKQYDGFYKIDKVNNVFTYFGEGHVGLIKNGIAGGFDAVIGDKLAFTSEYTSNELIYTSDLKNFKTATLPNNGAVTCVKTINNELYVSAYTKKSGGGYVSNLYKTTDLTNFELVYSLDFSSFIHSFCCYNDVFYFGTSGSSRNPESTIGTVFSLTPIKEYGGTQGKDDVDTTLPELGLFGDSGEYSGTIGGVVYEAGEVLDGETYAVNFTYTGASANFGFFTADKDGETYASVSKVENGKTVLAVNGNGTYTAYITVDKASGQGNTLYMYAKDVTEAGTVSGVDLTKLTNRQGKALVTNNGASVLEGKTSTQAIRYYFGYDTTDGKDIVIDGKSYQIKERGFLLANGKNKKDDGAYIGAEGFIKKSVSGDALYNCWQLDPEDSSNIWFSSYVSGFSEDDNRELFVKGYITFTANGTDFTIYADATNGSVAKIKAIVS